MSEDRQNKLHEIADQQIIPARRQCPACGLEVEPHVTSCPKDGTNLVQALEDEPAFKHRYEFLGTIGSGGMGVIYKARQTVLDKLVAIKMLHPHLVSTTAFRRFQVEGKAVGMLQHPYIINVHDLSITEAGQPYMVMDFVQGLPLSQVIERDGPLSVDRFLRIFDQICDAVAHAHNRGVLHRDLKPSNIMLTRREGQEEVRIMDFGIAKLIDADDGPNGSNQLTKTGDTIGSPLYMSPEQTRGGKTDNRSDLYSLGCVMYEALTGAPPFSGTTSIETMMMHLNEKPVSLSQSLLGQKSFAPDLEAMVARLLEKNPDLRYQSMEELRAAIGRLQSGKALDRFTDTTPKWRISWQVGSIAAALLACITAACVLLLFTPSKKTVTPAKSISSESIESTAKQDKEDAIKYAVRQQEPVLNLNKIGNVKDVDNNDMALLENATNANEIDLSNAHVDDRGLEHIGQLRLEKLELSGTDVKDLHALKNMNTLEELDLDRTAIGDTVLKVVAHLSKLRKLNLNKTGIVDSDLDNLVGLRNLEKLQVLDCSHLTRVGLARLQNKIPACKFVSSASIYSAKNTESELDSKLLDEARKLKSSGRFAEAAGKFGEVCQLLRKESNPNKALIAQCLKWQGQCLFIDGELAVKANPKAATKIFAEASKVLDQAGQALERVEASDVLGAKDKRLELTHIYMQQAAALELTSDWRQAFIIRQKIQIIDDRNEQIDNLARLGVDCVFLHKPEEEAEHFFKEAIARYSKIGKAESVESTTPMRALGDVYFRQNRWSEALPLYEHCIKIVEQIPEAWKQSEELRMLTAMTYTRLNRQSDAERLLKELVNEQPSLQQAYVLLIHTLIAEHKQKEAQEYASHLHAITERLKTRN